MLQAYDDKGRLINEDTSLSSHDEQTATLIVSGDRVLKYRYGSRSLTASEALADLRGRS